MHRSLRLTLAASVLALAACSTEVEFQPLPPGVALDAPTTHQLPFDPDQSGSLDHDRVNPDTSATLAHLFVHVPYALIFAIAAFLAWHHSRRATMERNSNPTAPLVDGPAVIYGTVEADPTWQGPVVRLDIHQNGTEWSNKGQWHHQWREASRTLNRRPFVVVRDDGARVLVDPDEQVVLRDEPDTVRHNVNARTRVAAIEPGQRVHVSGHLFGAALAHGNAGGAYRGGMGMPSLRAPRLGRMVISNERPGDPEEKRMRFHRGWAIAMAALFVFVASVVMPTFELLSLSNDLVWANPTAVRNWREWHKPKNSSGYWVYRWSVRGTWNDQGAVRELQDDCGEAYFTCVTEGRCGQVPFTVSTIAPSWHQIGTSPQLTVGRAIVLGILCLFVVLGYPLSTMSSRPWYQKKRLVEGGSGRLSQSHP